MAGLTTLTAVPAIIYAGDTLLLNISQADYPAPDWTVTYSFRCKDGSTIELAATDNGAEHLFSIPATTTAAWAPGEYKGVGRANDGTNYVTFWKGTMEVLADLSTQPDNHDTRSHAQKCLDAIEAVLEGKATRDILNTVIAGQSIGRLSPMQLMEWRSVYQSEVAAEQAKERAANGLATGKNIHIRFQ
jgi:hypothetical protein